MKRFIWNVLAWIDTYLNHGIADQIFNQLPESKLILRIWKKTCFAYCCWVHNEALEWRDIYRGEHEQNT